MSHVSPHFRLEEFAVSRDYPDLAKVIKFTSSDDIKLWVLCSTILEPLRERFGPIRVLSGKRTPELNEAIGGSVGSDHLFEMVSCAADITSRAPLNCFRLIRRSMPFGFGQLIWYKKQNFFHVSLPTPKHRGEAWEK